MPSLSSIPFRLAFASLLLSASVAIAQNSSATPTLKSVLLDQLKETHNEEAWFVPVKIAIEGLTPEQAAWKDCGGVPIS